MITSNSNLTSYVKTSVDEEILIEKKKYGALLAENKELRKQLKEKDDISKKKKISW